VEEERVKWVFSRDAILIMRSHEVTWGVPRPDPRFTELVLAWLLVVRGSEHGIPFMSAVNS
jgi:hypothetical protein